VASATELRDYQLEAIRCARSIWRGGDRAVLWQLPTGSGKTATASGLIADVKRDNPQLRVLVLVPKIAIIRSFARDLKRFGNLDATICCAALGSTDLTGEVVIASVQTAARRETSGFHIVICDEAHRLMDEGGQYRAIVNRLPDAKVLGLTATPFRESGYIYGEDKIFPRVHFSRTLTWTTEKGYTVKAKLRGADRSHTYDTSKLSVVAGDFSARDLDVLVQDDGKTRIQIEDALGKTHDRKKIIWAAVNISHAGRIADHLREFGEQCAVITSALDGDERELSLGEFESNPGCRHLVFVTIVAEGFDYAPIDALVLLRPTKAANLYVQMVGRGLRPAPGKTDCLVLDYGEVVKNCGPLDAPFVTGTKKKAQDLEFEWRCIQCHVCGTFQFPEHGMDPVACIECGTMPQIQERKPRLKLVNDEDSVLYLGPKQTVTEWEVQLMEFSCWGSQTMRRENKMLKVQTTDPDVIFNFFWKNPEMVIRSMPQWMYVKASRQKNEKLMEDLVRAAGCSDFDVRSIERRLIIPTQRVRIRVEKNAKGRDKLLEYSIMSTSEGAGDREGVSEGTQQLGLLGDQAEERGPV